MRKREVSRLLLSLIHICKMIASVHGLSMAEAADKPVLGRMIRERRFERYIILGNEKRPGEVREVYDERGSLLCRDL